MAIEFRYAVNAITGEFVYGSSADPESDELQYDVEPGLSPGQVRVVLPRQPDMLREVYSGDPKQPFHMLTDEEIAAKVIAIKTAEKVAAVSAMLSPVVETCIDVFIGLMRAGGLTVPDRTVVLSQVKVQLQEKL